MATDHRRLDVELAQEVLLDDPGFLRRIVERVVQQILEAEMTEHVGAAPHERTDACKGHRNGYKPRTLRTRVGTLNLLVPQDREGTFSTRLFARYQRNEKALCYRITEARERSLAVVTLDSEGRSLKAIARYLSVHKSTVHRILKRWAEKVADGLEEREPTHAHGGQQRPASWH